MAVRAQSLLGTAVGLAAILTPGLAMLTSGASIVDSPGHAAAWWVAYSAYIAAFLLNEELLPSAQPWPREANVAVMTGAGLVTWSLAPALVYTALLFVVTAGAAAFLLRTGQIAGLITLQTTAIAIGFVLLGWEPTVVVFTTLAYLAFQGFAAVVVRGSRHTSEAHAELRAAHAELRATSALLEESSREAERLRIARELHDVLGHELTALAIELEVASHLTSGEGLEHVSRARGIAKDLLRHVRATVTEMRATSADLAATLSMIVDHVPGLEVRLTVEDLELDAARREAVVRLVQEVLTNTLKHAHATALDVTVTKESGDIVVQARDDGQGVRQLVPGNGLSGMVERWHQLGGEVSWTSTRGEGFAVIARMCER